MIRLSKKVEYAILAIQYIYLQKNRLVTAKEIAKELNLTFEFISKILQELKTYGLIDSFKGKAGGYKLAKSGEEINFAEIIYALDEKQKNSIVDCLVNDSEVCKRTDDCNLRGAFAEIQEKFVKILKETKISEINKN